MRSLNLLETCRNRKERILRVHCKYRTVLCDVLPITMNNEESLLSGRQNYEFCFQEWVTSLWACCYYRLWSSRPKTGSLSQISGFKINMIWNLNQDYYQRIIAISHRIVEFRFMAKNYEENLYGKSRDWILEMKASSHDSYRLRHCIECVIWWQVHRRAGMLKQCITSRDVISLTSPACCIKTLLLVVLSTK